MNKKILLLDKVHDNFPNMLKNLGFTIDFNNNIKTEEDLTKIIKPYFGIIVRSSPIITKKTIDIGDNLKFIARAGSGIENIDYEYSQTKNIKIIHSPEGNKDAVAEHTIGLIICLLKKICSSHQQIKNGKWEREINRGSEIMGKTIGIIGYGNIGSALSKKLENFNVNILAHDKYKKGFSSKYVKECSLDEIYNNADILSLHIPLTNETIYYANSDFFNNFKKPFFLINTSRGKIVNTKDLVSFIKQNKIIGAGLDVIEYEDYKFDNLSSQNNKNFSYLLNLPNVILTPHIGGITTESKEKHAIILYEKIKELLN